MRSIAWNSKKSQYFASRGGWTENISVVAIYAVCAKFFHLAKREARLKTARPRQLLCFRMPFAT